MASSEHRAQVASRAAILREWTEDSSYVVVLSALSAEKDKALKQLRQERNPDQKTWLQAYLDGLDFAINIPERSFIEHDRQKEAVHG